MNNDIVTNLTHFLKENGNPKDDSKPSAQGRAVLDDLETMIYDTTEPEHEKAIRNALRLGFESVILVGEPGVGKTLLVTKIAQEMGLKVMSFNTPTMDPFTDLVGVPEVITDEDDSGRKKRTLDFIRREQIDQVDLIFLDELNRVPREKQNALFELVHSHAVNGVPLPKLKYVWAAINPQTEDETRRVEELEDAFRDRFWLTIPVEASPRVFHYTGGKRPVSERVARALCRWWYKYIKNTSVNGKRLNSIVTPRTLEYMAQVLDRCDKAFNEGKISEPDVQMMIRCSLNKTLLSIDTKNINIPIAPLLAILYEKEEFALSQLSNSNKNIATVCQEIAKDPEKAQQTAVTFFESLKPRAGAKPIIGPEELKHYSKALLSLPKEAGAKIFARVEVLRYFFVLFNQSQAQQRHIEITFPDGKVPKPTSEEVSLYNKYKEEIDNTYKSSTEK
jgi:MoxR-like ATPase